MTKPVKCGTVLIGNKFFSSLYPEVGDDFIQFDFDGAFLGFRVKADMAKAFIKVLQVEVDAAVKEMEVLGD